MTEAKLFDALYRLVYATPHTPRRPRELYDDRWVVMVQLWGVLHDRSQSWSCDPANWPEDLLDGRPLISQSRLSRRLRTVGVQQLLERLLSAATATDGTDTPAGGGAPTPHGAARAGGGNGDGGAARHTRPERRRALDMLHGPLEKCGVPSTFGRRLYDGRQRIESGFAGLACGGLGALPAFVRGPRRVALWAAGKLLAFTCRTAVKQGLIR